MDPSSTTMISVPAGAWRNTDARQRRSRSGRLCDGMTIDRPADKPFLLLVDDAVQPPPRRWQVSVRQVGCDRAQLAEQRRGRAVLLPARPAPPQPGLGANDASQQLELPARPV